MMHRRHVSRLIKSSDFRSGFILARGLYGFDLIQFIVAFEPTFPMSWLLDLSTIFPSDFFPPLILSSLQYAPPYHFCSPQVRVTSIDITRKMRLSSENHIRGIIMGVISC
jgi:hypothetical protein